MGKQPDLQEVAERIRKALERFGGQDPSSRVDVFESSAGNLRAVVVSDRFQGMGITERQEKIWDFLRNELDDKYLRSLYGVHPYTHKEFIAVSPASSTSPRASVTRISPPTGGDEENP